MNTASHGSSSHAHGQGSYDNAALRGASLAFRNRPSPSSTTGGSPAYGVTTDHQFSTSRESSNEALTAATSSAERAKSPARHGHGHGHGVPSRTAGSTPEVDLQAQNHHYSHQAGLVAARLQQLGTTSTSSPSQTQVGRSSMESVRLDAKNPSLIAATLAASRSTSPNPKTTTPRRVGSVGALNLNAALAAPIRAPHHAEDEPVDAASIPPTESLISMFEATHESKRSPPRIIVRESPTTLKTSPPQQGSTPAKPKPKHKPKEHRSEAVVGDSTPSKSAAVPLPVVSKSVRQAVSPRPLKRTTVSPTSNTPPVRQHSKPSTPNTGSPSTTTPKRSHITVTTPSKQKQKPTVPARSPSLHLVQSKSPVVSPKVSTPASTADLPKLITTPKRLTSPTPHVVSHSTPEVLSPRPTRVTKHSLRTTTPPPPIILRPSSEVTSPSSPDPKKRSLVEKTGKDKMAPPQLPKPRRSQRFVQDRSRSRPRGMSDTISPPKPVNSMYGLPIPGRNMKSVSPPPPQKLPARRETIATAPPSPTHDVPRRRFTQVSPPPQSTMHLSSLTSAIMAGSLASSRLTPHNTGSSLPPPPLPRRQKSPRLLQTLRQPPATNDDDEERSRKAHHHHRHKLRPSKHVHHEGSRKRWRDKITELERKRYEAIWASNRGLLFTNVSPSASVGSGIGTDLSDCVINVVVREIWTRSRLPDDELAEIWDLVDRTNIGYLTRQEFVVGMWLIDQCLRGRKLPVKVSESIWGSVNGVTVLKPRKR